MEAYVRNVWYMAGWESEVGDGKLLTRTLLDAPRLLYRKADHSGYVMMDDRCPHRFAPLSRGRREGDRIVCGYHGLTFDEAGKCVHNPFSKTIPPRASVTTFPVVARHSILWFWPGDPVLADPATIPDFAFLEGPTPLSRRTMRMRANYELLIDNLMDLSHVEFIHAATFKSDGAIFKGEHRVSEQGDGGIRSDWWIEDVNASFNAQALPPDTKVDKWLDMCWYAPATTWLAVGMAPVGVGKDKGPRPMLAPHIVTPETATSSHYFYTCEPTPEAEAFADRVFETEDKPMLEAVQANMGEAELLSLKPAVLSVDAGALAARRRLKQLRELESGGASARSRRG